MLKMINKQIALEFVSEKKNISGIIIPKQIAANQITFAKIVALPNEELECKDFKLNQYVVLGASPVWEKHHKHIIGKDIYYIVSEYDILAIIDDDNAMQLIDTKEFI